jgi:nitrogen-specific signal transduction histidine kinase/CheY-like chemotaxis protein
VNHKQVELLLARARTGVADELVVPGGRRVLLLQDRPGRAMAVVTQRSAPSTRAAKLSDREVAEGVSHELANALGAIAGWARLAKQGRRVQEALELIEMSAESAWIAARRMLGDAPGRSDFGHDSIDLSGFVDEAARLLGPKASAANVLVRTAIEPGLFVRGDRGNAWSIVWNLATNAVDALPPGGTVELRLRRLDNAALLVVEDDGPGMAEDQQRRIFEPYFTTKSTGTGLGLSMVEQAVKAVGGSIELHSQPGRGARFSVSLPLAAQRPGGPKRSSGVFYAEPIEHRILVVDDDLGLRELISTALSMRGADVVSVASGQAALQQTGKFAVAIIDLVLPDARGDIVLSRLRDAGLTRVGVVMTGTTLPINLAAGGKPDVLLPKPFELEELFDAIARALTEGTGDRQSAAG